MINKHLRKIKIIFFIKVGFIAALVIFFLFVLKDNRIFTFSNLRYQFDYVRYSYKASRQDFTREPINPEDPRRCVKSVPVLLFHGISGREDGVNITQEKFWKRMLHLKKMGAETISIDDFISFQKGQKCITGKPLLLTFDDGRKDSFYYTDPILKALDYQASIFIITSRSLADGGSANSFYLSENELQHLANTNRWDIGSHGNKAHESEIISQNGEMGHYYGNKLFLPAENRLESDIEFFSRIDSDFSESKAMIESSFNKPARSFSFPFGDFGENGNYGEAMDVVLGLAKKHYDLSFYQFRPRSEDGFRGNYSSYSTSSLAKRISIDPSFSIQDITQIIDASYDIDLPYDEEFGNDKRWIRLSGEVDFEKDELIFQRKNGLAMAYLDGSYLWKNYEYQMEIGNQPEEESISLLARYRNNLDYVSCQFDRNIIRVRNQQGGLNKEISRAEVLEGAYSPDSKNTLGMRVVKDEVQCSINGVDVMDTKVMDIPRIGGIGVKLWDATKQEKKINRVTSISARSIKQIIKVPKPADDENKEDAVEVGKKYLPYSISHFNQNQGWKKTWGENIYIGNALAIKAADNTTGGSAYLEGAENWKNYSLRANLDWPKGSNFVVSVRRKDEKNYIAFNVGKSYIKLEQYVDGKRKVIDEVANKWDLPKKDLDVKINIKDNRISCFLDGKKILSESKKLDKSLDQGGVGFKSWDKKLGKSEIIIKRVEAVER